MSVRISVALATYNGEKYLPDQLDSLLRQALLPAELVVGDDGSTDRTLDILEDFASKAKCDFITIAGRPGWKRLGKQFGYKAVWTYLFKEIA